MKTPTGRLASVLLAVVVAAISATCPVAAKAQQVTAVMTSGLRALDPIVNTSIVTSIHALMVYDLLLGQDSDGKIRPQMASWQVSQDARTYTFRLRDGLKWHDGAPVTAEDCVASIRRWAQADTMGQLMMARVSEIRALDARSFVIVQTVPGDLVLEALAKTTARAAFMMPKRMAETPTSQPVKETIGSGPFRFVASEFKPGIRAVYEKNRDYVPRDEPPSGSAGGKVVNIDRVEWLTMPDQMTAVNALLNGEIDFLESVPYDLLSMVEGQKGLEVKVLNKEGSWTLARLNFLHPPFNVKELRQAAMYAMSQEDVLKALIGNPKFYRTCPSVFGCGTLYESQYGRDIVATGNLAKAKELLAAGKYDGTPVLILHPSDNPFGSPQPLVIAQALRKAGFNVEVKTMDWQTLTTRRGNDKPPAEGGWNIFVTFAPVGDHSDPIRSLFVASAGKKSWFGWPDVPAIEDLRTRFLAATTVESRKEIAREIDRLAVDEVVLVPLGQYVAPAAFSSKLTGMLDYTRPLFWNVRKAN